MTDGSSAPPPGTAPRVPGLDVARAVAILGMILVNFQLVIASDAKDPAWLLAMVTGIQGRAAATFVVLAGMGAALMARTAREGAAALGPEGPGSQSGRAQCRRSLCRRSLCRRAIVLLLFGTLFLTIWPADILHFYGVWMLLVAPLLFAPTAVILGAALLSVLGAAVYLAQGDYFAHWNLETLEYEGLWRPLRFLENLFLNGFHPVLPWWALYLAGLALGRQRLEEAGVRRRLMGLALLLALSTHLVEAAVDPGPDAGATFLLTTASIPPTPGFVLAAGSTAVFAIMLCVEFAPRLPRWFASPLESTGQLALTIYVAHVVFGLGLLEEIGRLEGQTLGFAVGYGLAFLGLSVLAASLWRARFRRGPLELGLRWFG